MRTGGMVDWKWFALGSAFFAGWIPVLAKVGMDRFPSTLATFIRTVVVLIFVALLVSRRQEWSHLGQLNSRSLIFLILSGAATGLSWLFYYRALQSGPAAVVAPLDKLSVVIAVFLAVLVLKERVTLWQWLGAFLMGTGAVLMVFK